MKKLMALFTVAFFAISILSAPVTAGPGCGSLKGSKCALTGKTCTDTKKVEAKPETAAACFHTTLSVEGLDDTEKTEKLGKTLSATEGVYCVDKLDAEKGKAVICFDPAKIEAPKLATVITEMGFKAKVLSTAEGHPADCTPEKMAQCKKTCPGHADKK